MGVGNWPDLLNEDWVKGTNWDFHNADGSPMTRLPQLLAFLRYDDDRLRDFLTLPAARPMPRGLRRQVDLYLAGEDPYTPEDPSDVLTRAKSLLSSVEVKAADFDPRLHPRDRHGRFAKVPGSGLLHTLDLLTPQSAADTPESRQAIAHALFARDAYDPEDWRPGDRFRFGKFDAELVELVTRDPYDPDKNVWRVKDLPSPGYSSPLSKPDLYLRTARDLRFVAPMYARPSDITIHPLPRSPDAGVWWRALGVGQWGTIEEVSVPGRPQHFIFHRSIHNTGAGAVIDLPTTGPTVPNPDPSALPQVALRSPRLMAEDFMDREIAKNRADHAEGKGPLHAMATQIEASHTPGQLEALSIDQRLREGFGHDIYDSITAPLDSPAFAAARQSLITARQNQVDNAYATTHATTAPSVPNIEAAINHVRGEERMAALIHRFGDVSHFLGSVEGESTPGRTSGGLAWYDAQFHHLAITADAPSLDWRTDRARTFNQVDWLSGANDGNREGPQWIFPLPAPAAHDLNLPAVYRHEYGHHVGQAIGSYGDEITLPGLPPTTVAWSRFRQDWEAYQVEVGGPHGPGFPPDLLLSDYSLTNVHEGWAEAFMIAAHPDFTPDRLDAYSGWARVLLEDAWYVVNGGDLSKAPPSATRDQLNQVATPTDAPFPIGAKVHVVQEGDGVVIGYVGGRWPTVHIESEGASYTIHGVDPARITAR